MRPYCSFRFHLVPAEIPWRRFDVGQLRICYGYIAHGQHLLQYEGHLFTFFIAL